MLTIFYLAMLADQDRVENIYRLSDLSGGILYIDKKSKFFLRIEESRFEMGFPIYDRSNAESDQLREYGNISDCKTTLKCRSLGFLQFVNPAARGPKNFIHNGFRFSVKNIGRGRRMVFASCDSYYMSKCSLRAEKHRKELIYSYELDRKGAMLSLDLLSGTKGFDRPNHLKLTTRSGWRIDRSAASQE